MAVSKVILEECLERGAVWKELTSQVTTQHQIQDKEAVLIILERITHIDNERMIDLHASEQVSGRYSGSRWESGCTSSRSRRSWMMFATAFILTHLALLMYLSA